MLRVTKLTDYATVVLTVMAAAGDAVEGIDVPEAADIVNTYPIAVVEGTRHEELARAFVELVRGDTGRRVLRDAGFAGHLRKRLEHLIAHECRAADAPPPSRWKLWPQLRSAVVFHCLRHFPAWAGRLPAHAPRLEMPTTGGSPRMVRDTGPSGAAQPATEAGRGR